MAQAITLQVFKADQLLATQTFDRDIIKIGRLPSAHLRLDDLKVARIHAVIEMTGGGKEISLIDMGSAEGTFLNGEKVQKAKLKDQDQILLGETRLLVMLGNGNGATAAPPATAQSTAPRAGAGVTAAKPAVATPAAPQARPGVRATPAAGRPVQATASAGRAQAAGAPGAVAVAGKGGPQGSGAPTFDRSSQDYAQPVERISHTQLSRPAFDGAAAAAAGIEPEPALSNENRALELRLYWGDIILDIDHLVKPKQLTIGETGNTDIFISSEGLPKEEFPLIRYIGTNYILTFFNELEGEISADNEVKALRDMRATSRVTKDEALDNCYNLVMTTDTRALVHWGGLTMAMRFVPPPQKLKNAAVSLDYQFFNILLIVLFVMLGSIFSFSLYPFEAEALNEELMKSDTNPMAKFILEPPKPPEQTKAAEDFLKKIEEKEAAGPAKAKADEGKFGKDNKPDDDKKSAVKAVKPDDKEVIKNAGILKFLNGGNTGFSQVMGGTPGLGGDVANAIGNLSGKQVGDAGGLGGLGLRGTGPGGGGIGDSIGLAKGLGTQGRIGGAAGYGSDKGRLGEKKDLDINITDAPPQVQGALDPALIKKVIQDNRNSIKYCYERELQVKKELSGTIRTQFIISTTGSVQAAMVKESTMNNPNVENCIVGKIRGFIFPKPKGGGIVIVNYPFTFKSAN